MPRRLARLALRPPGQIDQRRQEAGQRLAGAGRRDQQHRLPGLGVRQQLDLVGARRPASLREPVEEWLGQAHGGILFGKARLALSPARGSAAPRNRQARIWNKR